MKSIIAAGILLGCAHGAVAAPYANIENKAKYSGDIYNGTTTQVHAGYDFGSWKIQGGPVFINRRNEPGTAEWSAKVKGSVKLNEDLKLYGELSAITKDKEFAVNKLDYGTKVGVTYTF